jgi:hypothetical protein
MFATVSVPFSMHREISRTRRPVLPRSGKRHTDQRPGGIGNGCSDRSDQHLPYRRVERPTAAEKRSGEANRPKHRVSGTGCRLAALALAAYNLWCVRRDRGRIDATRIADRAPSPTSRLRAGEIRRLKLDAFREPDRSIACPGGHVGTTNKSKASRRSTTAVDRLRLVPERDAQPAWPEGGKFLHCACR